MTGGGRATKIINSPEEPARKALHKKLAKLYRGGVTSQTNKLLPDNWKFTLAILAFSQGLVGTTAGFVITIAAIVGKLLHTDPVLDTLPNALTIVGTLIAIFPAAAFQKRFGRRAGFRTGAAIGLAGALVCFAGLSAGNFALFCLGHVFVGMCQGSFLYVRFASAEAAPPEKLNSALSLVLVGGVVAAFVGPWLAFAGQQVAAQGSPHLAYLPVVGILGLLFLVSLCLPASLGRQLASAKPANAQVAAGGTSASTASAAATEPGSSPRRLGEIVRQPEFLRALAGSAGAYALMILIMTAAPVSMHGAGHEGHEVSWVIQWHMLGMFAPSFFSGALIKKLGQRTVLVLGLLAFAFCAITASIFGGILAYWIPLLLLGIGWNFLFVASSARLTATYRTSEKEKSQAVHDWFVYVANIVASWAAAPLLLLLGWQTLNWVSVPVLVLTAIAVLPGSGLAGAVREKSP